MSEEIEPSGGGLPTAKGDLPSLAPRNVENMPKSEVELSKSVPNNDTPAIESRLRRKYYAWRLTAGLFLPYTLQALDVTMQVPLPSAKAEPS
jgi:hypothetical protein